MTAGQMGFRASKVVSLLTVLMLCWAAMVSAQVQPVVVTSSKNLVPSLGNTHQIAVNSLGDVIYADDGTYTVYELVPGSSTPIVLLVGTNSPSYMAGSIHGAAVDASNNLFIPDTYDGKIALIPFVNGAYPTNQTMSNLTACPVTAQTSYYSVFLQPTTDCLFAAENAGSASGYYMQALSVQFDSAGDMFAVSHYDNVSKGSYNRIIEIPRNQFGQANPTTVLMADNLPSTYGGQIAADSLGDVYYVDGSSNCVYAFAAGSSVTAGSTATCASNGIGTGLKTPGGVSVDAFNNLIITDTGNNRLVEIPYWNGSLQTSSQFLISYTYSANSVGIDPLGNFYYSGYANSATNINEMTPWHVNLGTASVNTLAGNNTVSFTFNSTVTPATIQVLPASGAFSLGTQAASGACVAATKQSQGSACTVVVTYTPSAVGAQSGALLLADASGNNIGTAYLYGGGKGAAQTVDPGTVTAIGTAGAWQSPKGIAVDVAGNVYVADSKANAVYEYASGSSTPVSLGSGLSAPTSVAVDALGNVYIADAGNTRVVEVPLVNGVLSNAAQSVIYSGTSGTTGLYVDQAGSLYIADSGNNRVLRLPNTSGAPDSQAAVTIASSTSNSAIVAPTAVTADQAGDVYIATTNSVIEVQAWTEAQSAVAASLSSPGGLAIDPSGSLYIADAGNQRLIRIPNIGGVLNQGQMSNIGATIANPYSVAIDGSGNLYVTDSVDTSVATIGRTQGTLSFGSVNLNSSSASLVATVSNSGNQTLTFGSPLYSASSSTNAFTVSTAATGSCADAGTLPAGQGCTLAAVFFPTAKGVINDTLTFASNAPLQGSLLLTGTGAYLQPTTLSVAPTSPATGILNFGSTATVTASLATSGGFTALGAPTGTINFSVDGQFLKAVAITAAGTAPLTISTLNGGIHTVTVSYSGDTNYSPSSSTSPATLSVEQMPTTATLSITGSAVGPLSATPGSQVTLQSIVTPSTAGATPNPSGGTVNFVSGSTIVASATVVTSKDSNGNTIFLASAFPTNLSKYISSTNDTLNIVAVYAGDTNYAASQSTSTALIISPSTFTLTTSSTAVTVKSGDTSTIGLTATSLSGFAGSVGLICTGMPANSTCSFTPNAFSLASGIPQPITLQVITGQIPANYPPTVSWLKNAGIGLPVSLAFLLMPLGLYRRKLWQQSRRWMVLLLFVLGALGAMTLSGCNKSLMGVTPSGTSTITITAQSGSGSNIITKTQTFTLTVQ